MHLIFFFFLPLSTEGAAAGSLLAQPAWRQRWLTVFHQEQGSERF